jgi:Cu(I)/Ag(I) efflux system membrane fusion protein
MVKRSVIFLAPIISLLVLVLSCTSAPVRAQPEGSSEGSHSEAPPASSVAAPAQAAIQLTPELRQRIGVTVGAVNIRPLTKVIRTVGRVDYDERRLVDVNLKIEGWIKDLYVDYTGKWVQKGQPLFTLYSPKLVSTQEEYLLALRTEQKLSRSSIPEAVDGSRDLRQAARERLLLWDLTPRQIRELEKSGRSKTYQTIFSPAAGYVIDKMAVQGMYVVPAMKLYRIADLSTVWIYADIYEYELPFIHERQEATVSLAYDPGEVFRGAVEYIYPYLDTKTRTNKVRFVFPNPGHKLKPGMYANMNLHVALGEKLVIPESAVLHSGVRNLVFVERGQGRIEPREVTLGTQAEGYWEVLGGLKAGDRIVTSGNFLIDSESKLAAAESMMGMMGQIGMGDWKMESAKPMEMGGKMGAMAGPQEKSVGNLKLRVSTAPEPATLGDNRLRIEVTDAQGQPVTDAAVALEYTMDMPGMMIDKAQASHTRAGVYEAKVRFTMAGPWGVTVSVQRPGQAEIRERFAVQVGG